MGNREAVHDFWVIVGGSLEDRTNLQKVPPKSRLSW